MAYFDFKNTHFANANALVEQLAEDSHEVVFPPRQPFDGVLSDFIDSFHECHDRCRAVVLCKNHQNLAYSIKTDC